MLIILVSLSFVCAFTPMVSPYDTVAIQAVGSALLIVYLFITGVFL